MRKLKTKIYLHFQFNQRQKKNSRQDDEELLFLVPDRTPFEIHNKSERTAFRYDAVTYKIFQVQSADNKLCIIQENYKEKKPVFSFKCPGNVHRIQITHETLNLNLNVSVCALTNHA